MRARVTPWLWVGLGVLVGVPIAIGVLDVGGAWVGVLPIALVAFVAGLVVWDVAAGAHPPRVEVDRDGLAVLPVGPDRAWACATEVRVPLSSVAAVHVRDPRSVPAGIRLPGTELPRVLRAGFFGLRPRRSFWLVRRSRRVLVVELRDAPLARIVVEVADPDAVAASIEEARRSAA